MDSKEPGVSSYMKTIQKTWRSGTETRKTSSLVGENRSKTLLWQLNSRSETQNRLAASLDLYSAGGWKECLRPRGGSLLHTETH